MQNSISSYIKFRVSGIFRLGKILRISHLLLEASRFLEILYVKPLIYSGLETELDFLEDSFIPVYLGLETKLHFLEDSFIPVYFH